MRDFCVILFDGLSGDNHQASIKPRQFRPADILASAKRASDGAMIRWFG